MDRRPLWADFLIAGLAWWAVLLPLEFGGAADWADVIEGETERDLATIRLAGKKVEPKVAKNRFHLDLETDDLEGEAARAEALGATRVADHTAQSWTWKVLRDPEGNEFCLGTAVPRPQA